MNGELFLESLSNISAHDYMHEKRSKKPEFFLKRARWLLNDMHKFEAYLKKTTVLHITGTSGKGSVGKMLQSILAQNGFNTGFYNSPHVKNVYERILVQTGPNKTATPISPDEFDSHVESVKPHLEKAILSSPYGLPSYFEILLIIAIMTFKKAGCNALILEAGCGGRYDATNIIPKKDVAIITSIGKDHEHIIGPRLQDIAYEKAGIITNGSTIIIGPTIRRPLVSILTKEAKKNKARIILISKKKMQGRHNDSPIIAETAARVLGIENPVIQKGIQNAMPLPGRFETINLSPRIILDGAHNEDKVRFLIKQLEYLPLVKYSKKFLIFGCVDTKKWRPMLTLLLPYFDKICLTRHTVLQRKSADLKELYDFTKAKNKDVKIFLDPHDAKQYVLSKIKKNDLLVATGSLYMLGDLYN